MPELSKTQQKKKAWFEKHSHRKQRNRRPPKPKGPISFTNIELAFELATYLGEETPRQIFHLWSAICLVGQNQALKMASEATKMYRAGNALTKDGIPRTLGGCWFSQMPEDAPKITWRMRQGVRQMLGLPSHSVPEIFTKELLDISEE